MVLEGGRPARGRAAYAVRACAVVLVLLAATLLAACGGGSSSEGTSNASTRADASAPTGGTIVWGKPAEAADLDPTTTGSGTTYQLLDQIYEPLVGLDGDLRPTPKLAASWRQTSPTTYVFAIRRGVQFSNGREMTVDDVVGSLKRVIDPKSASPWAVQLGSVKRIAAAGPWQVDVELAKPNSTFVPALAYVNASILPMKELRSGVLDTKRRTLGTGPFMVASHTQGEAWNLVRNPHYWRKGFPKADKLTIRIVGDDSARVAGLRDGSIDAANFDTPDALKLLQGAPGVKAQLVPTTEFYRLDVNAKTSLLADPRLREALSLALDRRQIADVALAGTSEPSAAVAPSFGTCSPDEVPYGQTDVERAKQLVQEAGASGKTVSLLATVEYKPIVQIAQVLARQIEAIGLKPKIEQVDQGEDLARVYSGRADFDVAIAYVGSFADPPMGLNWWTSSQTWHAAWMPVDGQLETLIEKSHVQQPGAARDATIKAACDRIAKDANIIPLVTKPNVVAYREDRVNAVLPKVEPYFDPMRHLGDFSVKAAG